MFILALDATAEASEATTTFWSSYGTAILTLLGTLFGASVGAFTTWRTTGTSLQESRKNSLLDLRREEYFSAIGIVHRMERALVDMASALSGREQPGIFASPTRRREADQSDRAAAGALEELFEASRELNLEVYRLGAIGSPEVRERLENISSTVNGYIESLHDGQFIANNFNETMAQYAQHVEAFVSTIRDDLEVDSSLEGAKSPV